MTPQRPLTREERERLLRLVERLGLVTASVDLLRDRDGELLFLEVNEQGQWLFIEAAMPHLPVLNAFANFLLEHDPALHRKAVAIPVALSEVQDALHPAQRLP